MGYYIDFEKITIKEYKKKLNYAYLPPSRMILKEKLDERFGCFENIGVKNVKELHNLLKKKDRLAELSKLECFSDDYLRIMLRELNSNLPKPNKISDFIWIPKYTIEKLDKVGITNTEKLYYNVLTKIDRQKFAATTGVNITEIYELTKISDLSRIKWVGVTYAYLLYSIKADTVEKVSVSNPIDLHVRINKWIKEHNIFKGAIGLNDVKILIETANDLPLEIEY